MTARANLDGTSTEDFDVAGIPGDPPPAHAEPPVTH